MSRAIPVIRQAAHGLPQRRTPGAGLHTRGVRHPPPGARRPPHHPDPARPSLVCDSALCGPVTCILPPPGATGITFLMNGRSRLRMQAFEVGQGAQN